MSLNPNPNPNPNPNRNRTYTDNAQITKTFLGIEDHDIMVFYVDLKWEGGGAGMGGYGLDWTPPGAHTSVPSYNGLGYQAIRRILETLKVSKWEDLPRMYVRVEHEGPRGKILKIGHITENRWFDLAGHMANIANK